MATNVIHDPNHPNILKLVGDVINANTTLNRPEVKAALFSSSNPLGDLTGKVDFVICFNMNGGGPDHAGADHSPAFTPRPFRGIVQIHKINLANDAQVDEMKRLLSLLIHELGHYWISFDIGQAKIRTPSGLVDTPTSDQMWQALNQGETYPQYPMIGRQDAHWSPFFDGGNSPYESGNHGLEQLTEGIGLFGNSSRYTQVECEQKHGPTFHLPGPGGGYVTTMAAYNWLELWIMGDLRLPIHRPGYAPYWPEFRVIEPRWVFPLPFQAGLYFETQTGDRFYFGYDEGPHQLIAQQSNGSFSSPSFQLPTNPYDPHNQVGLRIVQCGSEIHLQARVWEPSPSGCLLTFIPFLKSARFKPALNCNSIMGDLNGSPPVIDSNADIYNGWRTLGSINGRVARTGLSMRTFGAPTHARMAANLCVTNMSNVKPINVSNLDEDIPLSGPERLMDKRLMMPYRHAGGTDEYREDDTNHDAPKWTMQSPSGDFSFGGVLTLDACTLVSWAGGCQVGKNMVGTMRKNKHTDYVLPDDIYIVKRRMKPRYGFYKVLFCATSMNDADITNSDMENLDKIRRAFEIYFSRVTTRRRINTDIDY